MERGRSKETGRFGGWGGGLLEGAWIPWDCRGRCERDGCRRVDGCVFEGPSRGGKRVFGLGCLLIFCY